MMNEDAWEPAWLDREPPAEMTLDVDGLVESWVAEAEDWLLAFDGIEHLTPEEAFEGIELLARLARTRQELLQPCGGAAVLEKLRGIVGGENSLIFFQAANRFIHVDGWLEQAKEAWDDEVDNTDPELSEMLLMDLDAAESLQWFAESHPHTIPAAASEELEDGLLKCRQWMANHAELFMVAEPLVRAVAKTIAPAAITRDETGILTLSAMKLVNLLDAADQLWEDMTNAPSLDFIRSQPKFGRWRKDHEYQMLPAAAAAPQTFVAAAVPVRWHSPDGIYEAVYFLPPRVSPAELNEVEIVFGTGSDFAEPALALVGQRVLLGSAGATIEIRQQGGFDLVYARVNRAEVVSSGQAAIQLQVDDVEWV